MAISSSAAATLTDIADAIREMDSIPGPIPVSNFANRIQALPTAPPSGWPNNRRVYRFPNFLTTEQQDAMDLVRLDGAPAYEALNSEIYNMFKSSTWANVVGQLSGLPARTYDAPFLIGNKLYLGSSSVGTTLPILDTLTGRVTEIVGLPSRQYNLFQMAGSKMYCLHGASNVPSITSVVCIDTADDTFKLITVPSFGYGQMALVGKYLFLGPRNSVLTYIPFINTETDTFGSVGGLSSSTQGTLTVVGHKLYISAGHSSGGRDTIGVVDTTKIDPWDNPVKNISVQTGLYAAFLLVGNRYLYGGAQYSNQYIVRIDTQDDTAISIGPLPNRSYAVEDTNAIHGPQRWFVPFVLVGNRLYCGAGTAGTTIIVINHLTGAFLREITDLPSRIYTGFQLIGSDKLYVKNNNGGNTLVVIDPTIDTFSEITGLPSRSYNTFVLNGTKMYLLSTQSQSTDIRLLETTDDTVTQIPPAAPLLSNRAHGVTLEIGGKLYFGSGPVIDLATNTFIEEVSGWNTTRMIYANDKVYAPPTVLSTSVLPYQQNPTYIKYGS